MAKVPIACALTARDAQARVNEWSELLRSHVLEVERSSFSVRLRLRDGCESILLATDLAQREKVCCAFFEFHLLILANAVWLEIEIPDDAGVSLEDLAFLIAN